MPLPPPPPPGPARADVGELRTLLLKRVGPERAERYFRYLARLLSSKISKVEFNKLCLATLGRENLPLHNRVVRAVLKNAVRATGPAPPKSGARRVNDQSVPLKSNGRENSVPVTENGDVVKHQKPVVTAEGGREDAMNSSRGPIRAPLGIPFCSASVGGSQRPLPLSTSNGVIGGELCRPEVMRRRMEMIADAQGLGGVGVDCVDLINNGLDAYLKRLIGACVELVGARSGNRTNEQQRVCKNQSHVVPINGIWAGNHTHVQGGVELTEGMSKPRSNFVVSLQDFRVAMELNPQQLGEDWPLLLEKICVSSYEE